MSKSERQKYKITGPATWELIRAAYLAGESAPALAERFGVSGHAIRKRITVEKWTKRDYAAALEARGLPPPPKPAQLNIAARFAANYVPPPAPPENEFGPEHPFADLVSALKEATQAADEARSLRAETPAEPESLERAALASLSTALAKGRAADARALVGVAEAMRKRAAEESEVESAPALAESAELSDAQREAFVTWMFEKVAYLAAIMVHDPALTPNGFFELVKRWREINFGEGEEDAAAKAAALAQSQANWLSGDFMNMAPEDVRAMSGAKWEAMRKAEPEWRGVAGRISWRRSRFCRWG